MKMKKMIIVMVRKIFPNSKKIIFFLFILFFIFSMFLNDSSILANQTDSPPIDNNSPSTTLKSCLEWYEANHPTPIQIYHEGNCKEIAGYKGILSWNVMEGIKGRLKEECGLWERCTMSGTIGEITDETIHLEQFEFLSPDATSILETYDFSVYGFVRCTEPILRVEPEKKAMLVGEWIAIKVYLDCGYEMCVDKPVIIEVVSGPGELELPELTAEQRAKLLDLGYFLHQDEIIITHPIVAEAELHAIDKGTIEIKATYDSCRGGVYQSTITETIQINVGQCVVIDCTYKTDPGRFGESGLQWGGNIHCEVCLEVYQEVQYGMQVRSLRGEARGIQDCWVEIDDKYYWIENIRCPAFTGFIEGVIWGDIYSFRVSIDDSAALTFDECSGEKDRPQRLTRHEWDPVNFIGVPIHLDASDLDSTFVYEEKSNIIGTQYKVVARWQ
ncbi:MAG: hypothetical protein XE03_1867 [candidate division TA06 bacterium 34_109]|uniref:Uncharacterized protein n=1 Tax=candidate division TA06 bacterium 34_109 TaxID=1635277 RepID=A0A101HYR1_UNCT6|nr:MAG: hypothetical protein XE03_1867 [candidate division TA06 bacterium 34_109]